MRNQSENDDIPEEPENLGFASFLFEFNNFSFLINMIDNIIYKSESCDQNSNNGSKVLLSCVRDQYTALSFEGVLVTYILHIYVLV